MANQRPFLGSTRHFRLALLAHAATFTTNALITEADTSYDGRDMVVSGATLTADGRHSYPCS